MPAAATQERARIRLKKNDTVQVIAGRDAGKQGKILKVIPEKNRVIVQGVGFIKRHTRPNPQRNIKGGIAEREAPIHASNVMIVCGECGKRTRIGSKSWPTGRRCASAASAKERWTSSQRRRPRGRQRPLGEAGKEGNGSPDQGNVREAGRAATDQGAELPQRHGRARA